MFKHETQVIKFLLQWYSVNARNLPWRKKNTINLPDPYFVFCKRVYAPTNNSKYRKKQI